MFKNSTLWRTILTQLSTSSYCNQCHKNNFQLIWFCAEKEPLILKPSAVIFFFSFSSSTYLGGLGTKRFCSSADLGNYCNYVKEFGDAMEYRSCYFTCTGDGCNSGVDFKANLVPVVIFVALLCLCQ